MGEDETGAPYRDRRPVGGPPVVLYRPVGPKELALIRESGYQRCARSRNLSPDHVSM